MKIIIIGATVAIAAVVGIALYIVRAIRTDVSRPPYPELWGS